MLPTGKAINYTKDGRSDGEAKSNLFMMNNAFFILEELGPNAMDALKKDAEYYRIEGSWFSDKVTKIMDSEKAKYLCAWEQLNAHLTAVSSAELTYEKKDNTVLSHESGRLIKQRFSKFNEDFEVTYGLHLKLCVIDQRLRTQLQQDVASVFLPRYKRFYEKYTVKYSSFLFLEARIAFPRVRSHPHFRRIFSLVCRKSGSQKSIKTSIPSILPTKLRTCFLISTLFTDRALRVPGSTLSNRYCVEFERVVNGKI